MNLTITIGQIEKLYEIHLKLINEMETKIVNQVKSDDDITKFVFIVSNSIVTRKKTRN